MLQINDRENTMVDTLDKIESFTIFKDGKEIEINKENKKFNSVFLAIEDTFRRGQILPAFGVSLHNETLNALKSDEWLQINFKEELIKNGLPFTALLFKLDNVYGVDLIRVNNNRYEGRCIHLNFFENLNLKNIIE